ncbi:MAG: T9SS type A sorting domain-containing protein, partial [Paludibacteraceae bacterium]|nr:T9SS type A sorting domain-containing protein [Paludibacteraceae bacterium]
EALDDCCFKVISASNGKLFDLEGVNTASGTSVGVWEAGVTGENAHREWRVLAFPYTYNATGEESEVTEQNVDAMSYVFGERNNIKIYNLAENSMDICVYDVNGVCVHRMTKEKRSILSLPCKQGVYVVRFLVNGQEKTNKVIVK